jgi:hypothetical protein
VIDGEAIVVDERDLSVFRRPPLPQPMQRHAFRVRDTHVKRRFVS